MRRRLAATHALIVAATVLAGCGAPNAESPPTTPNLTKAEAKQLKEHMGCADTNIIAVVSGIGTMGMGAFSSPNVAQVLSVCRRDKTKVSEITTFWYDNDLGWFYVEKKSDRFRLWVKQGYAESD